MNELFILEFPDCRLIFDSPEELTEFLYENPDVEEFKIMVCKNIQEVNELPSDLNELFAFLKLFQGNLLEFRSFCGV